MTNILVAYDQQRAIGAENDLPWGRSLPGDLAMFKKLTLGTSVIMGRKTFDSLPPMFRPLPGRENIVLSRNPSLDIEGVICVNSLAAAISAATKEVFVIGGGQIYQDALPITDTIYATEVQATFPEADTFFPETDYNEWQQYYRVHNSAKEDGDVYDYDFVRYDRIK
ncbi:MAG: dihydrofolate reductase [Candidatus Saccharimonadales bacterium]